MEKIYISYKLNSNNKIYSFEYNSTMLKNVVKGIINCLNWGDSVSNLTIKKVSNN